MIDNKLKQKLINKDEKSLELVFIKACTENNLELVDYLLFSEELSIHPNVNCRNYQAIRDGANQGAYEVIYYLLNDTRINRKKELIEARKQVLIRNACHSGNIKLVKYLLETPGIKDDVNISIDKYKSFQEAMYSFNKELVFYLYDKYKYEMTEKYSYITLFFQGMHREKCFNFTKELIKHRELESYFILADKTLALTNFINEQNKEAIEFLITHPKIRKKIIESTEYGSVMVAMSKTSVDILNILIVENKIPLTNILSQFLDNKNYNTSNMRTMFQNRDLYSKLSNELIEKKLEKKLKI